MARKRMFDNEIINQEKFIDLTIDAKALYFLLGMNADDEGFVAPKLVTRIHGISEDALRLLILKTFVIPFDSGVIVITDWYSNNWLDGRRVTPTIYQEEKSLLSLDSKTKRYCLANAKQMLSKCLARIEENSIEENSIEENRINDLISQKQSILDSVIEEIGSKFFINDSFYVGLEKYFDKMMEYKPSDPVQYIIQMIYNDLGEEVNFYEGN